MIDASIYQLAGRGVKSVADYNAEADEQDMRSLKLLAARQGMAEQDRQRAEASALKQLVGRFGQDPNANAQILFGAGRLPEAMAYLKANAELAEKNAKTQQTGVETVGNVAAQFKERLSGIRSPQEFAMWLKAQYEHPVLGAEMQRMGSFEQAVQRIPSDPAAFAEHLQRQGMGMEKFIADQTSRANNAATKATSAANNAANNARSASDAAAGRAVAMRGQNMVDARQRDLNAITKTDKEAQRKADAQDKAVTKFSDTLQKEGIPEIEAALAGAEGAVGRYKDKPIPGMGRVTGLLPAGVLSEEGNDVRQSVAQIRNIVLQARSGAAVTDQELRRMVEELGTGFQSDESLRRGLVKLRARFEKVKQNVAAGVSDDVKRTYEERGGIKITRGSEGKIAAPIQSFPPNGVGSGADIDALVKKYTKPN